MYLTFYFQGRVDKGEIPVYKNEIKTPQYGDIYVLDKRYGKLMHY